MVINKVPDYSNIAALHEPGTGPVWKCQAIYRLTDEQVGQWYDDSSTAG